MQEVSVKDLRDNPADRQKPSTLFARKGRMLETKPVSAIKKGRPFVLINEGDEMKLAKGTLIEVVRADDKVVSFYTTSKGVMTGPAMVRAAPYDSNAVPSACTILANVFQRHAWVGFLFLPLLALAMLGHDAPHPSLLGFFGALSFGLLFIGGISIFAAVLMYLGTAFLQDAWEVKPKRWPPVVRSSVKPEDTKQDDAEASPVMKPVVELP